MSKYLGKLVLDKGIVDASEVGSVCVRYMKKRNGFLFRCGGTFFVAYSLVYTMCVIGTPDFMYKWSTGYVVREKKGAESFQEIRGLELDLLAGVEIGSGQGRRELMLDKEWIDNDVDFDKLCAIQYLYKFSVSFFDNVMRQWKRKKWGRSEDRWVILSRRAVGASGRGRPAGAKNVNSRLASGETVAEAEERCKHNIRVAVIKGYFEWYKEAWQELCKIRGEKFDKRLCSETWLKDRQI